MDPGPKYELHHPRRQESKGCGSQNSDTAGIRFKSVKRLAGTAKVVSPPRPCTENDATQPAAVPPKLSSPTQSVMANPKIPPPCPGLFRLKAGKWDTFHVTAPRGFSTK